MEKIHFENIIKSFFLGLFVGVVLLLYHPADLLLAYKLTSVLASGSIGLLIGLVTEWLTAILPIRMANAKAYFFINNLIALVVTTILLVALFLFTSGSTEEQERFMPILLIVLAIVCIANLLDFIMYRRAQRKLSDFKALMKDKG